MKNFMTLAVLVAQLFSSKMILAQDSVVAGNQILLGLYTSALRADTNFTYYYKVTNNGSSQQSVWQFWLVLPTDIVISSISSPTGWLNANHIVNSQRLIKWGTGGSYQITPGSTLGGWSFRTTSPPSIVRYYSEGYAPSPIFQDGMATDSIPGYSDLTPYGPGIVGTTVGPSTSRLQFYPTMLIDSVVYFISQARSFGWITTQSISDKYSGIFARSKTDLQQANLTTAKSRLDTVLQQVNTDSATTVGSQAYVLIRFNAEYLKSRLQQSPQVKGGIFNPTGTSTLSVRAKPSIYCASSDTLIALTATVRWQSRYSLTLGTVSSPIYGFSKYGSVTTVGTYNYQQFRTTAHVPLNWTAGSEYELFTIPVIGSAGVEDFTLTNALSGGQWFVDIDYLDKTDSVFYQPVATCTGLTSQNKADNWAPTAFNGTRHLAMTSTKLHEVYYSGGAIVYRRKSLTGSWEITQRISSDSAGNYNDASIIVAHDGSLHSVWQQILPTNDYPLFYNRSTDGGTTWGTARRIPQPADSVHIYFQQQWNIYPVIAELSTSQLVVVCCCNNGIEYTKSANLGQTWSTMQSTGATNHGWYTWYPSLANIVSGNCLILTYDTRYTGVWSQKYDGSSWSSEASVNSGVGTNSAMYSSVAFDWDLGRLYAAGSARGIYNEYGIIFRVGSFNNTWGSQFVQFPVASCIGPYWSSTF